MNMMGVAQMLDEEKKQKILEDLQKVRYADEEISGPLTPEQKYKLALKKKGMAGILNKLMRQGDDDGMDQFKIVKGS